MKQYFRGVVHGKRTATDSYGNTVHKYVIVGLLVTEEELVELEKEQAMLDGPCAGLAELLSVVKQRPELEPEWCPESKSSSCDQILKSLTNWDYRTSYYPECPNTKA